MKEDLKGSLIGIISSFTGRDIKQNISLSMESIAEEYEEITDLINEYLNFHKALMIKTRQLVDEIIAVCSSEELASIQALTSYQTLISDPDYSLNDPDPIVDIKMIRNSINEFANCNTGLEARRVLLSYFENVKVTELNIRNILDNIYTIDDGYYRTTVSYDIAITALYDIAYNLLENWGAPIDIFDSIQDEQYAGDASITEYQGLYNGNIITSIGNRAFYNCTNLAEASFKNVRTIGESAFEGCSALATVRLPSVRNIDQNAFKNCESLMAIRISATGYVPTLSNENAFSGTPMESDSYTGSYGTIYVPSSMVSAYQAASGWSTYASRITVG